MYQTLLKPLAVDVKNFILDTLFPISCLSCAQEGAFICEDCKSVLAKLEHQRCIVCQKPTPFGLTHPGCQTTYGADGLISFYNYHDEKVAKIIIHGKYYFLFGIYNTLGKMIAEKIKTEHSHLLSAYSCELAPVPLHPSRHRWRGFNQAEILCSTLSKELNLPMMDALVRNKITKTQKDLKKEQRLKNVSDAFSLSPSLLARREVPNASEGQRGRTLDNNQGHKNSIKGKNIILVDDVTTTGATLQEAAKVLKRNGAERVICLTVARD